MSYQFLKIVSLIESFVLLVNVVIFFDFFIKFTSFYFDVKFNYCASILTSIISEGKPKPLLVNDL